MLKFGDLNREYIEIKPEIDEAVQRVLSSGWFILGKEVEAFEKEFSGYVGAKYTVSCANGTDAIALALMALDIGYGDEVITTNLTAVPTISAISMTGATPVLVDVESPSCLIDPSKIEKSISIKTKALLPVHLFGQPCDMDAINQVAQKYTFPVIEDACQAHGSEYKGKKAGSLAQMGCFSFYPSKNLGCYGDGGAVTTDSEEYFSKLIMLRNYGQQERYYHEIIGINSRLDEIQAAILRVKLRFLEKWNQRRRDIASLYDKYITNPFIIKPKEQIEVLMNYHLYVIRVKSRENFIKYMKKNDIEVLIHYPVNIHKQKAYAFLGYKEGDFCVSEGLAKEIVSIPLYPQLSDIEVEEICRLINKWDSH